MPTVIHIMVSGKQTRCTGKALCIIKMDLSMKASGRKAR